MFIMVKKCVDCSVEAKFRIKDTSEYYCEDCADEHFADLAMLIKVEEEITHFKKFLDDKLNENLDNHDTINKIDDSNEASNENAILDENNDK
jgi:hypothetical protein